jgi:methanogenic corrinoid protein MtbC1
VRFSALRLSAWKFDFQAGGAPVTPAFAEKIEADGYADDAAGAARLAMQWMG